MPKSIVTYFEELPNIGDRNPWEIPVSYLEKKHGNQYEEITGRRPSKMFLVNKLRKEVDNWRNEGYPGATITSRELLAFWFEQPHHPVFGNEPFHFYFCQQEAIETIIFLYEVKGYKDIIPVLNDYQDEYTGLVFSSAAEFSDGLDGVRKIIRYYPDLDQTGEQDLPEENLLRYAIKMATGSGKTFVMSFVVVWSYFNRLREKDRHYANNFLLVAPNVIVYERLAKDYANGKVFREFPFIPDAWLSSWKMNFKLRGDDSPITAENNFILNNIHQLYESRAKEFTPTSIVDAILGRKPQKDLSKPAQTLLERVKELDNLLVMNDEAHHVHDDDLKWNESLITIHNSIPGGLKLWLDFSATPKTPNNTYYPWIICDYPLAQAVEDRIVKVPLIIHKEDKQNPENVTQDNVVQKYGYWITTALARWKEHYDAYQEVGKKPVLFVMAEKNVYADKIAESIQAMGHTYCILPEEVMVIHTDNTGDVRKGELESLREEARDVDNPDNKVKVIVSVLMLREGWDVQNVSIVLGLRAFDSPILPEQAVGRGLRLMRGIGPDCTQTLEIIGNEKFENVVRQLELEGVGVSTFKDPPPLPVTIAPEKRRMQYDISIPQTDFSYCRAYNNLGVLDAKKFPSLFTTDQLKEGRNLRIYIETLHLGVKIQSVEIKDYPVDSGREYVAYITLQVMKKAGLTNCFDIVYPLCEEYLLNKCFEVYIDDVEDVQLRRALKDIAIKEAAIDLLAQEIGKATVSKKQVTIQGSKTTLSKTPKFTWRRGHISCKKTVFNFVATYNPYEAEFAEFLDKSSDVEAFAALASIFRIDYLSDSGAIRYYFPDFIAKQKTADGVVFWIIETKGREYTDLNNKNNAITRWCKSVTQQTRQQWKYMLVKQTVFNICKNNVFNLGDLELSINGQQTIL